MMSRADINLFRGAMEPLGQLKSEQSANHSELCPPAFLHPHLICTETSRNLRRF